ncbi:sugar transferase [Candidatus Berkelbacteria bacterium]|nr:sugar transferase [Candidatus Berkelbacteria bacterium]
MTSYMQRMKRSELLFTVLLVPMDALAVFLGFLLAYQLRTAEPVIYILPLGDYLRFVLGVLPLWLLTFALEGLYEVRSTRRGLIEELSGIFVGVSLGVLLFMAAVFLTNTSIGSRIVLLYAYVFSFVLVVIGRWLLRQLQRKLFHYGIGVRRVILVGESEQATQLARAMSGSHVQEFRYLGYVSQADATGAESSLGRRLGSLKDIERIIEQQTPDEIIVAETKLPDRDLLELLSLSNRKRIDLKLSANRVGLQTSHVRFHAMAGIPLIEVQRTKLEGWGRVVKRTMDVLGAITGIVLFSPVMLATALAVKLTSPGPMLYLNERVGQDQRLFFTYKFRSMRAEYCTGGQYGGAQALKYEEQLIAKQNTRRGAIYKVGNDPRLTPIGDLLRKFSLDEFPQFFNVLFGHMSLVGPRPHQPREVARYEPWQEKLFTIKPGITGLAQISGRSDLNFDDEARLDISYIENWSLWQDLKILLRTPLVLLRSRKAA